MKYHQIEAFYQVMLTRSISKAAINLGRTQPAVSMTISTLEDLLGTPLFDRHAGRLNPRAEAHVLFEQVGPVIRQLTDIRARFNRSDVFPVPRISIISANNPGVHMIPSAIAPLAAEGQDFRLMNGTSSTIISEIESQRYDIGLSDHGPTEIRFDSPLFEVERFEVAVCALYPAGLLGKPGASVDVEQLATHPICMLYSQHRTASEMRSQLPSPRVEFENFFPMACYALATGSVAILDAITSDSISALTNGPVTAEFRPIKSAVPADYYLLRPLFRPRSEMADRAYVAIKNALEKHSNPSDS